MGAERNSKIARRERRRILDALERAGVSERARAAFLGLKRDDVQAVIRTSVDGDKEVPWAERPSFDTVAREALEEFGYDLTGITLSISMKPGRVVMDGTTPRQLPPTIIFKADASEDAVREACAAAGIKTKGLPTQAVALN